MLETNNSYREMPHSIEDWPEEIQADYAANIFNPHVGTKLVSETDQVRVWHLSLAPGEKLSFHRHVLDYFWTVTSAGRGCQYYEDGRIIELDYAVGDTKHLTFNEGEYMVHNAINIGETLLGFVTVEFLHSANAPLPLPGDKMRK